MFAMNALSRRTFLSTAASLVATGASFMFLPNGYAARRGGVEEPRHGRGAHAQPSFVQGGHPTDDEMNKCIRLCQDCHALCIQTVEHCLTLGGRHAAPDHIRLLQDCAELCETTARYLIRGSSLHERVCGVCAEACRQCGESCVQVAGDDQISKDCAEICRRCGDSCKGMASNVAV
jgi:hypothetical protein